MPPADAAPDPLDRPAAALWHEFESFYWEGANADRFGSRGGLWLPSCPWYGLLDWQRDLARRLAAAALAADRQPQQGACPHCGGTGYVTGYRPCPECVNTGRLPDAGGRP